MVGTRHFHCWGLGWIPWSRELRSVGEKVVGGGRNISKGRKVGLAAWLGSTNQKFEFTWGIS